MRSNFAMLAMALVLGGGRAWAGACEDLENANGYVSSMTGALASEADPGYSAAEHERLHERLDKACKKEKADEACGSNRPSFEYEGQSYCEGEVIGDCQKTNEQNNASLRQCEQSFKKSDDSCIQARKKANDNLTSIAPKKMNGAQPACRDYKDFQTSYQKTVQEVEKTCNDGTNGAQQTADQSQPSGYVNSAKLCGSVLQDLQKRRESSLKLSGLCSAIRNRLNFDEIEQLVSNHIEDSNFIASQVKARAFKQSAEIDNALTAAGECTDNTVASAADAKKGEGDETGEGSGGGKKKDNAEDDSTTTDKDTKKKKKQQDNGMGALMSALGSMLGAGQGTTTPTTTTATGVQPATMPADYCYTGSTNSACVCPVGSTNCIKSAVSAGSQMGGNSVGGALLTKDSNTSSSAGAGLSLGGNDTPMDMQAHRPDDGGGGGRGMYAGGMGGGGGAPHGGAPKADPPAGRGKSALSADILQGVKGGSGGLPTTGSRFRPSEDKPADRPGATFGLTNEKMDLNQYVPQQGTGEFASIAPDAKTGDAPVMLRASSEEMFSSQAHNRSLLYNAYKGQFDY